MGSTYPSMNMGKNSSLSTYKVLFFNLNLIINVCFDYSVKNTQL